MNHNQLRTIINTHDPVGLLAMDAPEDEYDPEVKSILARLKNNMIEEEVRQVVFEEFIKWFGKDTLKGSDQLLVNISKDIYNTTKE